MKCIDAFTSSGILGLRWAVESSKHAEYNLEVTLNDLNEECCELAMHNAVGNSRAEYSTSPPGVDPSKCNTRYYPRSTNRENRPPNYAQIAYAGLVTRILPPEANYVAHNRPAAPTVPDLEPRTRVSSRDGKLF